jgi:hypothetical protein
MERLKRVWIDLSLFISNIIKMNVQRATCIRSIEVIELYKQWYTLADFLPNWNFCGVFSIYYSPEGTAKLRWARGHYIFMRVPRSSEDCSIV